MFSQQYDGIAVENFILNDNFSITHDFGVDNLI